MTEVDILDLNDDRGTRILPDANMTLAMGILSIVMITIIGLMLSIATIVKANSLIREYERHPILYKEKPYKKIVAGKKCAIAGLLLKATGIIVILAIYG